MSKNQKPRIGNKRLKYDAIYYDSDTMPTERMLHLRIYTNSPLQIDLWLTPKDREILNQAIKE